MYSCCNIWFGAEVEVQPTLHNTVLEYGNLLLLGGGLLNILTSYCICF